MNMIHSRPGCFIYLTFLRNYSLYNYYHEGIHIQPLACNIVVNMHKDQRFIHRKVRKNERPLRCDPMWCAARLIHGTSIGFPGFDCIWLLCILSVCVVTLWSSSVASIVSEKSLFINKSYPFSVPRQYFSTSKTIAMYFFATMTLM